MQPFKVLYASFDGGDNTAFIPMAVTNEDENKWLCCFPEATSDEGEGLIDVKTQLGHIEKVTFGVEDFSEVSPKSGVRMGSIMFEYHIRNQSSSRSATKDYLPSYRLINACPADLLAATELEKEDRQSETSDGGEEKTFEDLSRENEEMRKECKRYREEAVDLLNELNEKEVEVQAAAADRKRLLEEHDADRQRILERARRDVKAELEEARQAAERERVRAEQLEEMLKDLQQQQQPAEEQFVLKRGKEESPAEESGQREYMKAHTNAMNALAERMLNPTKTSETSDIRPEKIERFTELGAPTGKPLQDMYRTDRWELNIKRDMREGFPNDVDSMFQVIDTEVGGSHKQLVAAIHSKTRPHELVEMKRQNADHGEEDKCRTHRVRRLLRWS